MVNGTRRRSVDPGGRTGCIISSAVSARRSPSSWSMPTVSLRDLTTCSEDTCMRMPALAFACAVSLSGLGAHTPSRGQPPCLLPLLELVGRRHPLRRQVGVLHVLVERIHGPLDALVGQALDVLV